MALEARWAASQPVAIDHRSRIDELERRPANLIGTIKSGGASGGAGRRVEDGHGGADARADRPDGRAAQDAQGARETVERRIERLHERLAEGGELAQEVVAEISPTGICLYPDPDGGGILRAYAQTALQHLEGLIHAEGRAVAPGFPRVYDAVAGESRREMKRVAGSDSGGWIRDLLARLPRRTRDPALAGSVTPNRIGALQDRARGGRRFPPCLKEAR